MSTTKQRVRVGIVGAGGMAQNHLKGLSQMADVQVAAICDVAEHRAQGLAAQHSARPYSDPQRMLAESSLDAVYILLPPFAHGAAERAALEHRVPFFIEKPVGMDVALCHEIAAAVKEQNLLTCVGYMNRYRESVRRARQVFQADPAVLAHGGWISGTPRTQEEYGIWRWWSDKRQSGGQFVEQVTHTVDLVRYLMGEVVEVFAHGAPPRTFNRDVPDNYNLEDALVTTLRFQSGAVATLWAACACNAGGGVSLSVFGTQHAAHFTGWEHTLRLVAQPPGAGREARTEETIKGESDIFALEDRHFIDAVKSGDRSLIRTDYPDGVKTTEVTVATNRSLETGQPVSLA